MLIEVTRFQFQMFWCSHGDINDPWYLYLVGRVLTGSIRAACLGVVRRYSTLPGRDATWYATSYEDTLAQSIVSHDCSVVRAQAAVALLKQTLSPNTATAEWSLLLDMDDEDEWIMPLLSDIQASYARMEPVCLLK
jgi:hypothetical protein